MRSVTSRYTDLGLLFVVVIWGLSPSVFKIAFSELEPLTFVFVRFLLLSALSLAVLFVRGRRGGRAWRISRADVPLLIVSGLSGYGFYQLFYMIGLAHTTVFASALFISTVPIWSLVILAVLKAERVHPVQWAGIALSLVGLAGFLFAATGRSAEVPHTQHLTPSDLLLGNLLSLAAGALFALYGVTNKRLTTRYSPPELMCYTLLVGTLALAPFGIPALLSQPWQHVTWRTLLIVPYSVIFPIYLTYSIWNWAIGVCGVGYVTVYTYAVPIASGVVAWILLGEGLTLPQIGAGAVVIAGMLAARWGASRVIGRAGVAIPGDTTGAPGRPREQEASSV